MKNAVSSAFSLCDVCNFHGGLFRGVCVCVCGFVVVWFGGFFGCCLFGILCGGVFSCVFCLLVCLLVLVFFSRRGKRPCPLLVQDDQCFLLSDLLMIVSKTDSLN